MQPEEYRTSPTLIVMPASNEDKSPGNIGVYDYLTKKYAYVSISNIYWLEYFAEKKSWPQVLLDHKSANPEALSYDIANLTNLGFLVVGDGAEAKKYDQFSKEWKWDLSSALFHFTILDNEFESQDESTAIQLSKLEQDEQPTLTWTNGARAVALPSPFSGKSADLLSLMAKRRTNRTNSGHELTNEELSTCLFAGIGITSYVETPTGNLPLSMTPSGGARNPFEAFVILNRGAELVPGVYHYSGSEHSLQKLESAVPEQLHQLLANQEWTKDMAAVIILVAVLERTMWKYSDANAYRVVLIEAGHIAQNIMVAATNMGLCACPTAALAHGPLSEHLGLEALTHTPVYALTLEKPLPNTDKIFGNPLLRETVGLLS
jgi:SagB-type dehydrogenase family enzyme